MLHAWRKTTRLLWLAIKYRLDTAIAIEQVQQRAARGVLKALRRLLPTPQASTGTRLRNLLVELGPVYIKLGQLLSTRRDLLPPEIADELALLQDQVPHIKEFDVATFVEAQLGCSIDEVFKQIDHSPLASASIAQVHAAELLDGSDVVIKVVRPGIEATIRDDMSHLRQIADAVERYIGDAYRLHLPQIVADHEQVLLQELNMFHESRNQIQLRRNFAESDLLYVPRVYPQFTRDSLIVMERVYGTPVGNVDALVNANVDLKVLAHKGVETFFTQVFRHNFFHADMHPGNILIDTSDIANPRYIALDCAIIGSLTEADQNYLAQNLVAFFNRDYAAVARLHLESGWIPASADTIEFERVIREVCDPIFAKPLAEISFAEFVVELFRTAGEFDMEIQPQLVLLQKTLLYIEGVGRQLYPQLDLWETAQPFMEEWVAERLNPAAVVSAWLASPEQRQVLMRLPTLTQQAQRDVRELKHQTRILSRNMAQQTRAAKNQNVYRSIGLLGIIIGIGCLTSTFVSPDAAMWAGITSTLLGVALIIRA